MTPRKGAPINLPLGMLAIRASSPNKKVIETQRFNNPRRLCVLPVFRKSGRIVVH